MALARYLYFHGFLKKALNNNLFKINNQFHSSSVELGNNPNWEVERDKGPPNKTEM